MVANFIKLTKPKFSTGCVKCGSLTIYVDDSTYCINASDPQSLAKNLSEKYQILADFLNSNGLKVNDDKTHTMCLTTSQMRRSRNIGQFIVKTGGESNKTSEVERLLGAQVHMDLKWTEMIQNNENSLMKMLTSRTNALSLIGRYADF